MSEQIRIAVINLGSGLVDNVAVITDGDGSTAPDGFKFVPSDEAAIGDAWDGAQIVKAVAPEDVSPPLDMVAVTAATGDVEVLSDADRIDALEARMAALEARVG